MSVIVAMEVHEHRRGGQIIPATVKLKQHYILEALSYKKSGCK